MGRGEIKGSQRKKRKGKVANKFADRAHWTATPFSHQQFSLSFLSLTLSPLFLLSLLS